MIPRFAGIVTIELLACSSDLLAGIVTFEIGQVEQPPNDYAK
jgi:hypothetical protein